jgi:DNA polymerase (family 10)
MDSRSAAYVLSQIGALLAVKGEQKFKARAYAGAARSLIALDTDDLAPLLRSGELADTPGIGPATLSVVRELVETGESSYLNQLREGIPEGLLDVLRVPGLSAEKVQLIHGTLGVDNLEDLERVKAQNGQLASPEVRKEDAARRSSEGSRISAETRTSSASLRPRSRLHQLLANVVKHPDITHRRSGFDPPPQRSRVGHRHRGRVLRAIRRVAESFARSPGVRESKTSRIPVSPYSIRRRDAPRHALREKADYPVACGGADWRTAHVEEMNVLARNRGFEIAGNLADRKEASELT